jgi:hypothetical protein
MVADAHEGFIEYTCRSRPSESELPVERDDRERPSRRARWAFRSLPGLAAQERPDDVY